MLKICQQSSCSPVAPNSAGQLASIEARSVPLADLAASTPGRIKKMVTTGCISRLIIHRALLRWFQTAWFKVTAYLRLMLSLAVEGTIQRQSNARVCLIHSVCCRSDAFLHARLRVAFAAYTPAAFSSSVQCRHVNARNRNVLLLYCFREAQDSDQRLISQISRCCLQQQHRLVMGDRTVASSCAEAARLHTCGLSRWQRRTCAAA